MPGKLKLSKNESEQRLLARIEEIDRLMTSVDKPGANFFDELKNFTVELEGWRELNLDVLSSIFSDGAALRSKYVHLYNGAFLLTTQKPIDVYDGYKREIKKEIGFLRTCIKKLEFYEEHETSSHAFTTNQNFTAFLAISDILKKATKSILLIDGYIDQNTLAILSQRQGGVSLSVLTKKQSATPAFKVATQAFAKEHGTVEIRQSEDYHDRYIILDDTHVYQSGGSLKDLGGKAATLLAINTPKIAQFLIDRAKSDWDKSAPL